MKVALGSDHNAYDLKETIKKYLELHNHEVVDYGCYSCDAVDYPDVAFQVALDLRKGEFSRAILVCGTGIGMAIAAGKVPGIRAALCHDTYSAERARKSNNAQVLTMGAKVIGPEAALKVVEAWMNAEFEGGNSSRKVNKIMEKEQEFIRSGDDEKADQQSNCSC
ncbi:ribose 5-phosphate isomerase [Paenibacillus sp. 32O-W]|jgi:ribose 5-phosphate isomerase B|uniref:Ribose-5-phosphate isomerase n=1 Tax=Paenibacillus cisolokensis TaxID=1658519 RepID=A0ABQ4N476_9BACL|nr:MULTISPECIES: ribose 5-phosphate isomerase B [Paenibacillus]ALS28026.1 ribose 5-phosphate isomerase [Paenibacillus sp. 32O-W]GIQ62966.1 ribose-5-phosphate isomerase [Paenibacillus cisolokensis]